ncbi:MAG: hypothetical protein ACPLN0_06670 [Candidatus Hydrothermia bacterium]
MKVRISIAMMILAALSINLATAEEIKEPVISNLKVYKVIKNEKGEELKVSADSVKPGDILEYELTYKNVSSNNVENLTPLMKIPDNTEFIGGSAKSSLPSLIEFSIDNGRTYKKPPIFKEIIENGKKRRIKVPPSEYTNVRWTLRVPLKPGNEVKFYMRVKVK